MLGSHLTLNRSLATHILLVRLQPQPLPPPHLTVRSWLSDFDIAHPFLLSSRTLCDGFGLQWTSTILLLDAFTKTRRRLARGPRAESLDPCVRGLGVFYFCRLASVCSLYSDMYLPLMYCIKAVVCRLYEMCILVSVIL